MKTYGCMVGKLKVTGSRRQWSRSDVPDSCEGAEERKCGVFEGLKEGPVA